MNLLHIDSSILGENSVSRKLSADIVAKLIKTNPDIRTVYRDLASQPVPHLSGAYMLAAQSLEGEHEAELQADLTMGREVMEEFLAANTVVIGVPFYNFGIPSQLKAWIDRILIAGKTFQYGADGQPIGLAADKRVILAIARGGFYGEGSPAAGMEHAESHLRAVFGFIGITRLEVIVAEGLAVGPEHREAAIAAAEKKIAALVA
ncbi:NAD(P)H-dependent oxidoreductase [Gluconobacter wancherniae]|uniref:FMN-dependent NADH-azoreductase n=1 Tax=Gluconobacter TaxID=441 RepID=UPI000776F000|nr:NAD(P)H-dependent oxidoreductase [Gluconobacter thailandicus]KXV36003.1 FMN-dependent NADH-azoreductase [Gluconobacter thailandicus]